MPMCPQPRPPTKPASDLHRLVNSLDPAKKRVAFLGWPDTVSAEARVKHIETLLSQHAPSLKAVDIDNNYQGPYDRRVLSNVAFAEFTSVDAARRALDYLKNANRQIGNVTITIKPARTETNSQRNYSLRKAEELIKASPESKDSNVKISWDSRAVQVDDTNAFTQSKRDTGGTFLAPYEHLSLP